MTTSVNTEIPYKMTGPNLAKFSSCILSLLWFQPKIIFLLLQYSKGLATLLENDHRKWSLRPRILVHPAKWKV